MTKRAAKRLPGKRIAVFTVSPVSTQRATVVAGISLLFFFLTMLAYYVRQWAGYFGLATAFLVVNIFTLIGLWLQKRNSVRLFENGVSYRSTYIDFDEIERIALTREQGLKIVFGRDSILLIPAAIEGLQRLASEIDSRIRRSSN